MPMPNFVRHINKRLFNRRELANGHRPVITHTGRTSGTTYRTPLEAHPIDGGYGFVLMYGADRSDWVQNVLAAGRAILTINGSQHQLANPRVTTGDAAFQQLPAHYRRPPRLLNVTEVLLMDLDPQPPDQAP